jgi:drug/metabolite transporter (DMT)-like permease
MTTEIILALVASLFTATSSVAQRLAAAPAPGEITFSWRLVLFLLHRRVWFFGILCMILGFAFQLAALHGGQLSLVQPVISTELLFVFAFLALRRRDLVRTREWAAAIGMAVGLGAFLFLADPSDGSPTNATQQLWIYSAITVAVFVVVAAAAAIVPWAGRSAPAPARKAALLAVSAGILWGFVASVIKELASHISQGPAAVFANWSPYVLLAVGAVAMFLVANAFQAGPLAASQPGLTIADPLVASLLGVTLFGEQLRFGLWYGTGEVAALLVLVGSIVLLSRSPLISDKRLEAEAPVAELADT